MVAVPLAVPALNVVIAWPRSLVPLSVKVTPEIQQMLNMDWRPNE